MQAANRHFHAWILHIDQNQVTLQPMPGEYASDLTCRRHAIKAAGGDSGKVVVLMCRGEEKCPSNYEAAALAT